MMSIFIVILLREGIILKMKNELFRNKIILFFTLLVLFQIFTPVLAVEQYEDNRTSLQLTEIKRKENIKFIGEMGIDLNKREEMFKNSQKPSINIMANVVKQSSSKVGSITNEYGVSDCYQIFFTPNIDKPVIMSVRSNGAFVDLLTDYKDETTKEKKLVSYKKVPYQININKNSETRDDIVSFRLDPAQFDGTTTFSMFIILSDKFKQNSNQNPYSFDIFVDWDRKDFIDSKYHPTENFFRLLANQFNGYTISLNPPVNGGVSAVGIIEPYEMKNESEEIVTASFPELINNDKELIQFKKNNFMGFDTKLKRSIKEPIINEGMDLQLAVKNNSFRFANKGN